MRRQVRFAAGGVSPVQRPSMSSPVHSKHRHHVDRDHASHGSSSSSLSSSSFPHHRKSSMEHAVSRARRIQLLLAAFTLLCARLWALAFSARPKITVLGSLWVFVVVFFLSNESSGVLHASQKTENKFWMAMNLSICLIVFFLADDSPLKMAGDAEGLTYGVLFGVVSTYLVHFAHKRSHRQSLENRASIPKNRSYREAISSLAQRDASLEDLEVQVNTALSKLESAIIPGGFRRLMNRDSFLLNEKRILDLFQKASRAELNYLVLHVNMNVLIYRIKNRSNTKDEKNSSSPGVIKAEGSVRRKHFFETDSVKSSPLSSRSSPVTSACDDDDDNDNDHDDGEEHDSSFMIGGEEQEPPYDDPFESDVSKGNHRNALLQLLAVDRLAELSTSARAALIDAIQVVGLVRNPLTKDRAESWAARIILQTVGDQLSELKTITDAKGSVHSMHKLIYNDITNPSIRASLLTHFQRNRRSSLGRKVLSDVDDTFLSSGGRYPAGIDEAYPRHFIYPGAGAFYESLDLGVCSPTSSRENASYPNVYGSKVDLKSAAVLFPSNSTEGYSSEDSENSESENGLQFSPSTLPGSLSADRKRKKEKKKRNVVGNLVFLSARPHVYKDMAEKRVYQKFERFIRAKNLHAMPTLLPGDLESGQAYMLRGDFEPMALKKLKNMVEYYSIYPEFTHVFVCDNGQADVRAAELMKERLGSSLEVVYVHKVQPIDKTFGYDAQTSYKKWHDMGIVFYTTFVGAAADACERGLIDSQGLRRVCIAAAKEFALYANVNGDKFHGGLVGMEDRRIDLAVDFDRANKVLVSRGALPVEPPQALCLYPVGITVYTEFFGEGFVRSFRPSDGVYHVVLFGGVWNGYFTAKDLQSVPWEQHKKNKYRSGLFPGQKSVAGTSSSTASTNPLVKQKVSIRVGCRVTTPYGMGIVRRFRPADKIYEVSMTRWSALAFLCEEDVVAVSEESSESLWGLGKKLYRRTFSRSSPTLTGTVSPASSSPPKPSALCAGMNVLVPPFGRAVVVNVVSGAEMVHVRFEDFRAFGTVRQSSCVPVPAAQKAAIPEPAAPQSSGVKNRILSLLTRRGGGGDGKSVSPISKSNPAPQKLFSLEETVLTPYGFGVVDLIRADNPFVPYRVKFPFGYGYLRSQDLSAVEMMDSPKTPRTKSILLDLLQQQKKQ